MRKETDLEQIKKLARMFLLMEPEETKFSPAIVKHPFTDSGIVGLHTDSGGIRVGDIMQSDADRWAWQKEVSEQIENAESVHQIHFMITNSYRLGFLRYSTPYLSQKDMSKILSYAWISTEAPNSNPGVSKRKLLSMFKAADPEVLMDADEYAMLKELEDPVTIYRGVTSYNARNIKAMSWTLDRETAEWFAHRFEEDGTVYEAQISKEHIYALFNGRNEAEIIVDPLYLTDITEVQDMDEGFQMTQ